MWAHGGDILSEQKKYPGVEFIDFSANINPLGQPESVVQAIKDSAVVSLDYPDPFQRKLKTSLSEFEGVDKNRIICGNGAAEIIFKIAYFLSPKKALVLAPTFSEYEQALSQVGTEIKYYYLKAENDFLVQPDIIDCIDDVELVFLCNPNNPTGSLIDKNILKKVLECCAYKNIILVVDECFVDFLDDTSHSLKSELENFDNLILVKAFTKSFAIPGIRLGYALFSDLELAYKVDKIGPPWSVSTTAQLAGIAATKEKDFLVSTRELVDTQRKYLVKEFENLVEKVYDSHTNYIFFYSENYNLREELLPHGIIIRDCSNYIGLGNGYYRIAVKTGDQNEKLINAMKVVKWEQ